MVSESCQALDGWSDTRTPSPPGSAWTALPLPDQLLRLPADTVRKMARQFLVSITTADSAPKTNPGLVFVSCLGLSDTTRPSLFIPVPGPLCHITELPVVFLSHHNEGRPVCLTAHPGDTLTPTHARASLPTKPSSKALPSKGVFQGEGPV
jgi:hypothetical protein